MRIDGRGYGFAQGFGEGFAEIDLAAFQVEIDDRSFPGRHAAFAAELRVCRCAGNAGSLHAMAVQREIDDTFGDLIQRCLEAGRDPAREAEPAGEAYLGEAEASRDFRSCIPQGQHCVQTGRVRAHGEFSQHEMQSPVLSRIGGFLCGGVLCGGEDIRVGRPVSARREGGYLPGDFEGDGRGVEHVDTRGRSLCYEAFRGSRDTRVDAQPCGKDGKGG